MTAQPSKRISPAPVAAATGICAAVHAAAVRGLIVGRQVKIGIVRGVVIGYNIAQRGRFPGRRYPLLVKTELGVAKCRLAEVAAV